MGPYDGDFTFVSTEGYELVATPGLISILHNWNFGTSRDHYKNPDKNVIVQDKNNKWVRITKIEETLDEAMGVWENATEQRLL